MRHEASQGDLTESAGSQPPSRHRRIAAQDLRDPTAGKRFARASRWEDPDLADHELRAFALEAKRIGGDPVRAEQL